MLRNLVSIKLKATVTPETLFHVQRISEGRALKISRKDSGREAASNLSGKVTQKNAKQTRCYGPHIATECDLHFNWYNAL